MKKKLLGVLVLVATFYSTAHAQLKFKKLEGLLNLGLGVNSYYNGGIPISATYEMGVTPEITVGGGIDYLSHNYNYNYNRYASFTAIYIGARGSYHFNELFKIKDDRFDVYAGVSLGYRSFSWKDNSYYYYGANSNYGSGIYLGVHAGGRYYFSKRAGAFLELGALGSTNARVGVTLRF